MLGNVVTDGIVFQLDPESHRYGDLPRGTTGLSLRTLDYRRIDELHLDPLFLAYMQHPLFRDLTRRRIGEDVSVFRSMFMNKPASKGTELPWHQDVGKGWGDRFQPDHHGMDRPRRGHHGFGLHADRAGQPQAGDPQRRGTTPPRRTRPPHCSPDKVIDLEVEAGEAVLIHNWLLHRSGINRSGSPRRAFSIAYMDAATRTLDGSGSFPVIFGEGALKPQQAA